MPIASTLDPTAPSCLRPSPHWPFCLPLALNSPLRRREPRFTIQPLSSRLPARALPSSNLKTWSVPTALGANPLLRDAAAKYNIPWVRHDFPLPFHAWSMKAAVNARWFDTKSKKIGDEYRDAVFANQPSITNPDGLRQFTEKFAKDRGIALPFAMDPQGSLASLVKADYALGQRIGIEHTPTIWVVTANSKGAPFVEVVDRTKLYELIDQALADTRGK